MHALHDRPYLHGACGDRLRHVSYFLSHRHPAVLSRRHHRPGAEQFQRDARHPPGAHRRSARAGRRVAAGPSRLLQSRPQRRLRGVVHRAGPVLPRGQPADAPHVRPQPGARQPGGRLVGGRLSTGGGPPRRRPTTDRRIAALVAERIADGATLQTGIGAIPNAILSRSVVTATSACTRSYLRRCDGSRRDGVSSPVSPSS